MAAAWISGIRPEIYAKPPIALPQEFPELPKQQPWSGPEPDAIDWPALIAEAAERGAAVPEVAWCRPGEAAALDALAGPKGFLTKPRLSR